MEVIENFGIITSISWNSNEWKDDPTEMDLKKSNYDFVKENAHAHEALNFGHKIYPAESDGTYIAYTPIFNRLPSAENSKNVHIVFFISTDYSNNNRKMIVGCYGYPTIDKFTREAEHEKFEEYDFGNVCSPVKDIIYFDNYIEINNENAQKLGLLPKGKKISQQGFNYLNSENVFKILSLAVQANPKNKSFKRYITCDHLEKIVEKVALQINADYQGGCPLFLGVMNGSFMFCSDLLKLINFECQVSFVKLASYQGLNTTGKVSELVGLKESITDRDIIVVEDIVDTGNTLEKLFEVLQKENPRSIKVATLLLKPSAYKKDYPIDYVGMEIPPTFVLGYGLDYDGLGRNLNSIYRLNEE